MRKIGIMGGTFNPIHMGHLMLAEDVRNAFCLDEIWLIPTGCSYMKAEKSVLSSAERYHMASLAAADNEKFRCLDIEIKREGYCYTYETLEELREAYPEDTFFFLTGADCLFTIENWREPERIFANCHMIASVRGDASLTAMEAKRNELAEKYHAQITLFPFRNLELSSTDIRERVRQGKSIRYLVPDKVCSYIEEKGFYKE